MAAARISAHARAAILPALPACRGAWARGAAGRMPQPPLAWRAPCLTSSSATFRAFASAGGDVAAAAGPSVVENYQDGPSELVIWQDERGLIAQHDEIQDIDGCKWAIARVCHHMLTRFASPERSVDDMRGMLLAVRFLVDLAERVERLDQDGYSTCAVELFERPWIVSRGGAPGVARTPSALHKRWREPKQPLLQLRPRPDSFARRAMLAIAAPIIAPVGALVSYLRSGGANSLASCKWYFRAITEVPCHVELDGGYRLEGCSDNREELAAAVASGCDGARRFVHGSLPQLAC